MDSEEQVSIHIPEEEVGLDNNDDHTNTNDQNRPSVNKEIEVIAAEILNPENEVPSHQRVHSVSICINESVANSAAASRCASERNLGEPLKSHSQPLPKVTRFEDQMPMHGEPSPNRPARISRLKDKRFDSFKTLSGRFQRQITMMRGKTPRKSDQPKPVDAFATNTDQNDSLPPANRYFDALEGPELDILRESEEILLPDDKLWPFLLRFPISTFSICLGLGSQSVLWKTLPTTGATEFLHINLTINLVVWCIAVATVIVIGCIYLFKMLFYFEAVRREYFHPIRNNFFFAPFIALLFLTRGVPPSLEDNLHSSLWYILMFPILCLELKIYGQWMSGGERRLSKVANPVSHLSIVGNFVGAFIGASMGLKEGPIFFFAVGLAHYIVLFVTLYQRLTTNETVIPKELHPVFFLFVSAPSMASMAWTKIHDAFDVGSRIGYFVSMFLYLSLVVRINFFRGFKFSLAWWAYTFPMTGAAAATVWYCNEVTNIVTQSLAILLSIIATLVVLALCITTLLRAFVSQDLFPNDLAIAISDKPPNRVHKNWFHLRHETSSDSNDVENVVSEVVTTEGEGVEAKTVAENTSAS